MERDFMGIGRRELVAGEDSSRSCGGSVLRPLPSKAPSIQHTTTPFKPPAVQGQSTKTSTGFHPSFAFDSHHKMTSQKSNGISRAVYHPSQVLTRHPALSSFNLQSDPRMSHFNMIAPSQALPSLRQPSTPVSSIPRDKSSTSAQLTIFYGGYVNVYDNVPLDKAQAIMFMATNASTPAPAAVVARSNPTPVASAGRPSSSQKGPPAKMAVHPKQLQGSSTPTPPKSSGTSPRSGFSSPISAASHTASTASIPDERKTLHHPAAAALLDEPSKSSSPAAPPDPPTSHMPRPVPMMRKLSLARFLEKRKDRFTSLAPYTLYDKAAGGGVRPSSAAAAAVPESSSASGREEWSWQSSSSTKNWSGGKPPNTNLEM